MNFSCMKGQQSRIWSLRKGQGRTGGLSLPTCEMRGCIRSGFLTFTSETEVTFLAEAFPGFHSNTPHPSPATTGITTTASELVPLAKGQQPGPHHGCSMQPQVPHDSPPVSLGQSQCTYHAAAGSASGGL